MRRFISDRVAALLVVLALSGLALASSGDRFVDLWTTQTRIDGAKTWIREQAVTDKSQSYCTLAANQGAATVACSAHVAGASLCVNIPVNWDATATNVRVADDIGGVAQIAAGTGGVTSCATGLTGALTTIACSNGGAVVACGGTAAFVSSAGSGKQANLAVDTNVLMVNGLTNRVGINTTNPTVALDVTGAGLFSGALGVVAVASISTAGAILADATETGSFAATNLTVAALEGTTIGAYTPSTAMRSTKVTCNILVVGTCAACTNAMQVDLEGTTANLGAICTSAVGTTVAADLAVTMTAGTTYAFQLTAVTTCSTNPQILCNIGLALPLAP